MLQIYAEEMIFFPMDDWYYSCCYLTGGWTATRFVLWTPEGLKGVLCCEQTSQFHQLFYSGNCRRIRRKKNLNTEVHGVNQSRANLKCDITWKLFSPPLRNYMLWFNNHIYLSLFLKEFTASELCFTALLVLLEFSWLLVMTLLFPLTFHRNHRDEKLCIIQSQIGLLAQTNACVVSQINWFINCIKQCECPLWHTHISYLMKN